MIHFFSISLLVKHTSLQPNKMTLNLDMAILIPVVLTVVVSFSSARIISTNDTGNAKFRNYSKNILLYKSTKSVINVILYI